MSKTQPVIPASEEETAEVSPWVESKEIPGLLLSRNPIADFDEFMRSLPDFGEDGERLHQAIIENRAIRRAMAAEKSGEHEC